MIKAALEGKLTERSYSPDGIFGLMIPDQCPGVPSELLNPMNTWTDPAEYLEKAYKLAALFNENFAQYEDFADEETKMAAPVGKKLKVNA
jgi:phosphoenolpyruvate carboxykinase (ATP)